MQISVRGKRIKVEPGLRDEVRRSVYFALGRFADVIRKVEICLTDGKGVCGGMDKNSRIVVLLKAADEVVAEAADATVMLAIDRACYRVKRLVGRAVERRNKEPGARSVRRSGSTKEE